jgi:probable phosphoglycerate mutase
MTRRLLYLARHGETDWNATHRWQGQTDVPLNAQGRAQARAVAGALRAVGVAAIVASDLSRAHETASIIGNELALPIAYVDSALRERSFGCFEGLTREECERLHPDAWRLWKDQRSPPLGAEGHEQLTLRAVEAIERVARRVARDDAPALVVTHGGVLRAIVAVATGALPAPVKNGAIWKVAWEGRLVGAEEACLPSSTPPEEIGDAPRPR